MEKVITLRSAYMSRAFEDLKYIADDLGMHITKNKVHIDTLIGIGFSGALVVPTVAQMLGYHWAIVRKRLNIEGSHSSYPFEGALGKSWLFVDDRIETGKTLNYVCETIDAAVKYYGPAHGMEQTKYIGSYTYEEYPRFSV